MTKTLSNTKNLQILYEDNHIIAINKRCGDIVQGDKTGDKPLSEIVKSYLKEKYNKNKIWKTRKIIHVDMDSFFASLEIRDKPELKNQPVAVGGKGNERGVLTTCNYIARKFGLHSAMSSKKALSLCKHLIILPVNIDMYKQESKKIFKAFK